VLCCAAVVLLRGSQVEAGAPTSSSWVRPVTLTRLERSLERRRDVFLPLRLQSCDLQHGPVLASVIPKLKAELTTIVLAKAIGSATTVLQLAFLQEWLQFRLPRGRRRSLPRRPFSGGRYQTSPLLAPANPSFASKVEGMSLSLFIA